MGQIKIKEMKMNGRRAVIGLCMLCALLVSAVAAGGASASTSTTGYTCVKKATEGGAGFSKEHCTPADAVTSGAKFEEVAIPKATTTELSGTNAKTCAETTEACPTFLKSVSSGVKLQLKAVGVTGTGTMTNNEEAGGKMSATGTGVIHYTGVTVTEPAGKGCEVFNEAGEVGKVDTTELVATTKEQGDFLKFEPKAGAAAAFAVFTVKNCTTAALNKKYEVTGSVKGVPNGATTVFGHEETTKQETLKLGGQNAGIEGAITLSVRANSTQTFKPLFATTTEP